MTLNSQLYMLFDNPPHAILAFLQFLAQAYALPSGLHILDVGCGPGRLLQMAADCGWQVTGLEPDDSYYQQAQNIAVQAPSIAVYQGGFAQITTEQAYDLIAAVNAPFGYLLTPNDRRDALRRCFKALRPGGVLFLDLFNFLWILRHYRPPEAAVMQDADGATIRRVIRHDVDWHESTFTHTDTFYRNTEHLSTQVHKMAIIPPSEILYGLADAGFREIQTYNNYGARRSQRINKDRIMVSAQKPVS